MKVTVTKCCLFDLAAGECFSVIANDSIIYMAMDESKDGKRYSVNLHTGRSFHFPATAEVNPHPHAELHIKKV